MGTHVVICGLDGLAVRIVEELQRLQEEVLVVTSSPGSSYGVQLRRLGVEVVEGDYRDEATLLRAGADRAQAIALVEQDDVGNVHAALTAQSINPALRVVIRLFNDSLGQSIQSLLTECTVLSASSIAAPLFVAAALDEGDHQEFEIAGHRFRVAYAARSERVRPGVIPLAPASENGAGLFPDQTEAGGLVLWADVPEGSTDVSVRSRSLPTPRPGHRFVGPLLAVGSVIDRRLRWLLVAIGALVVLSVAVFSVFFGLSPLDALYFTLTTVTTTGYGDITVLHASLPIKLYGIALLVTGAGLIAVFYALLIESVVGARLTRALGGLHGSLHGHVVVCGLGNLGSKIVSLLCQRGIRVVVVERDDACPNLPLARRLKVPVILADAARPESLHQAQIGDARSLVVATNEDVSNLETALNARQVRADLRVVLRLFDHDLAARVERAFGISISRSVSSLAAPAFAAALIERRISAVVPVGRHVVLIAEVAVDAGSSFVGARVNALEGDGEVRVVGVRRTEAPMAWPATDLPLRPGDVVVVATSRTGLARLLRQARVP